MRATLRMGLLLLLILFSTVGASAKPQPCQLRFGLRWAWLPSQPYTASTPLELARIIQNKIVRVYLDELKFAKKYPTVCLDEDNPDYIIVWQTSGYRVMVSQSQAIRTETKVSGQVGDQPVQMRGSTVTWVPVDVPKDTFIESFDVYKMGGTGCMDAPASFNATEFGGNSEKAAKKALKKTVEYLANPAKATTQTPTLCVSPERIGATKPAM